MQILWLLLAAGLMLAWLVLAVRGPRRVEAPSAAAVLRYGSVARTLTLALALAPAMIMVYMIGAFPWEDREARRNLAGLLFLAVSIVAGLPLIEVTRVQVILTEEGLTRYSPWSETVTLKWIEIERVGYSAVNRWFVVEGRGRAIRVSRYLAGIGRFVELLRRHVAAERWASAAAVLEAVK